MDHLEKSYQFFLTKKQVDKLKLFKKILVEKRMSVVHFGEYLGKTTLQLRILVKEIVEEQQALLNQSDEILYIENHTIYLAKDFNQEESLGLFLKLRKFYYEGSPNYRLLIHLFEQRQVKMSAIAETLAYSQSYCYKLIDYLNEMFVKQQMPIAIKKNGSSIRVSGQEICIRMYHYLLEIVAQNIYIDVEIRSEIDWHARIYELSQTTKIKHDLAFYIMENALLKGHSIGKIPSLDHDLIECLSILYNDNDWKRLVRDIKKQRFREKTSQRTIGNRLRINEITQAENISEEKIKNEIICYSFWTILFIPETIQEEQKVNVAQRFQQLSQNKLVDFAQSLINQLDSGHHLSKKESDLVLFEIIVHTWAYQHLRLDKFMSRQELGKANANVNKVEQVICQMVEKHRISVENKELYCLKMAQILYSYMKLTEAETVQIGISTLKKPEYIPLIRNVLKKTYNSHTLKITDCLEEADIIVSDGLMTYNKEQYFVYLGNVHSMEDWANVNALIQAKILEKCI